MVRSYPFCGGLQASFGSGSKPTDACLKGTGRTQLKMSVHIRDVACLTRRTAFAAPSGRKVAILRTPKGLFKRADPARGSPARFTVKRQGRQPPLEK